MEMKKTTIIKKNSSHDLIKDKYSIYDDWLIKFMNNIDYRCKKWLYSICLQRNNCFIRVVIAFKLR